MMLLNLIRTLPFCFTLSVSLTTLVLLVGRGIRFIILQLMVLDLDVPKVHDDTRE